MTAPVTNCPDISTVLKTKASVVKAWHDSGPRLINDLTVRKFSARAETLGTVEAAKPSSPDKIRFRLLIEQNYKQWAIELEMAFHCSSWIANDGSINSPGLLFNVIDEDGAGRKINYYPLKYTSALEAMDAECWCQAWLQKLLKHPDIKVIFPFKKMVAVLED